ncbi:hypothetical protein D3C72_2193980 [compost metagenome]
MVTFARLLACQPGHHRIGHQKQFQVEIALLLFQGNSQTQGVKQGFVTIGGAIGNQHYG